MITGEDVKKFYSNLQKRPFQTILVLVVLIVICIGAAWINGFFGKKGEQAAISQDGIEKPKTAIVERPFLNIKLVKYMPTGQYFSIREMDSEKWEFIFQFQLEIHNVGKNIAKDITFLKCEVRGLQGESTISATPIVSSDLGPDAKHYSKVNLVIAASPANFTRLPSGKIHVDLDFSMIEFDVVLKYSSDMDPKKEYRIDASYQIKEYSAVIKKYKTL